MPSGFIQGLLGGLAGGYADASWEQHQQELKNDLTQKQLSLEFIKEAMNSPNFRPEFLPVAFEQIQQIISAKPGTKKGRSQTGNAMQQFIGRMTPQPTPEQIKAVDPTGRRDRYQQEVATTGTSPRGFPAIPGIDPMFRAPAEQGSEEFQAQKPLLEYKTARAEQHELDILDRQRTIKNMEAQQQEKMANLRQTLRDSADLNKYKLHLMAANPDLTEPEARYQAANEIIQSQAAKQRLLDTRQQNMESLMKTREERLETTIKLANSLIKQREFNQQVTPLLQVIITARGNMGTAESRVRSLTAGRQGLINSALAAPDGPLKTAILEQIKAKDAEIDAAYVNHQNAVEEIRKNTNLIETIGKGQTGTGMSPVPSTAASSKVDPRIGRTIQQNGRTGTIIRINPDNTAVVQWH